MNYRVCNNCKGNFDTGELIGGLCEQCIEKQEKRKSTSSRMEQMARVTDFQQIEMDFGKESNANGIQRKYAVGRD